MKRLRSYALPFAMLAGAAILTGQLAPQAAQPAAPKSPPSKTAPAAAAMTNQDVIRLVKAKIAEDLIVAKIKQSKTKFDV
jgi:hypothetical protein